MAPDASALELPFPHAVPLCALPTVLSLCPGWAKRHPSKPGKAKEPDCVRKCWLAAYEGETSSGKVKKGASSGKVKKGKRLT